jgi:hypothetical protein
MKTAAIVVRLLISLTGLTLLLLGILFWTGRALGLLPLHMLLGAVLVLLLWLAAGLALRTRVSLGLILLTVAWSLIMPAFGMLQMQLLPGRLHWLIQLAHLVIGMIAIGLGHGLARRVTTRKAAPG